MHRPKRLGFHAFGDAADPLVRYEDAAEAQTRYLRCYLHDLSARSLVIEPNYFDRDYLSEFAAFYATSSAGHRNICERVHYFSIDVTHAMFVSALSGDETVRNLLQDAYLGHVVIRPIIGAPIGRTVLRTYPDEQGLRERTPRVMEASRTYRAHIAGLTLTVEGLAWQQQDEAVGSCATVALWSMLHSSAFDEHHAIPTTAAITALGHSSAPTGLRTYPDSGLQLQQVLGVIKGQGLAPLLIKGDLEYEHFSRVLFCTLLGSLLRSGYPVLVSGSLDAEGMERPGMHSVCVVGFRSAVPASVDDGTWQLDDQNVQHIYIHDDNLGLNARFLVRDASPGGDPTSTAIRLVPDSPEPRNGPWPCANPAKKFYELTPSEMIVAVHHELRTNPFTLQQDAVEFVEWLPAALAHEVDQQSLQPAGEDEPEGSLHDEDDYEVRTSSETIAASTETDNAANETTDAANETADAPNETTDATRSGGEGTYATGMLVGTRFIRLRDYLDRELGTLLHGRDALLASVRLALWEEVPPMSLYIAVVRVSLGSAPMVDILFDTSDSDRHLKPTAYVAFHERVPFLRQRWNDEVQPMDLGIVVKAWAD